MIISSFYLIFYSLFAGFFAPVYWGNGNFFRGKSFQSGICCALSQINFPLYHIENLNITPKKQIKHAQACLIFQVRSNIPSGKCKICTYHRFLDGFNVGCLLDKRPKKTEHLLARADALFNIYSILLIAS